MLLKDLIQNLQKVAKKHPEDLEVELCVDESTFTLDEIQYVESYNFYYASKNVATVLLMGSE